MKKKVKKDLLKKQQKTSSCTKKNYLFMSQNKFTLSNPTWFVPKEIFQGTLNKT